MRRIVLQVLRDPRNRVGAAFVVAVLLLLLVILAVEQFG